MSDTVTPRELDVLARLARGHSNPEIAAGLGISVNTVKDHLRSAYAKLGVSSRVEAARWYDQNHGDRAPETRGSQG